MASKPARRAPKRPPRLPKAPTGISGLDEITGGGLPRGRTTLVCGGTGCGKTLLGVEFLVRGAQQFGEPGVLMSFEEMPGEIAANVAALGFDLPALEASGMLSVDQINTHAGEIDETGDYDLDGLFLRLGWAIDQVGAKRVVIDTIETLFTLLSNERLLRSEIRRLFRWLNDRGMTAVVTGERGEGTLTRYGLEEYVSDCVISLDQRVERQSTTRRMRVVKYRGSAHGGDEYPFIITAHGLSVMPVTSLVLRHRSSDKRIPTGMPGLDAMLGGKGFYRGSSVLLSGSPGAGKTSLAAGFAEAACRRGERTLYMAYEESPDEIARNMRSIAIDLSQWIGRGLLSLCAERPSSSGFEAHLARLHARVEEVKPSVVVVDPISAFHGPEDEITALLSRIVDYLKGRQVTALLTSMATTSAAVELSGLGISSVIDTWITLRALDRNGERNRVLDVLKARGIGHSNQTREFVITDRGLDMVDVYADGDGIAVGSERVAREGQRRERELERDEALRQQQRALAQRRAVVQAQIAALQAELALEIADARAATEASSEQAASEASGRAAVLRSRHADPAPRHKKAAGAANGSRR